MPRNTENGRFLIHAKEPRRRSIFDPCQGTPKTVDFCQWPVKNETTRILYCKVYPGFFTRRGYAKGGPRILAGLREGLPDSRQRTAMAGPGLPGGAAKAGHGRPWPAKAGQGRPWPALVTEVTPNPDLKKIPAGVFFWSQNGLRKLCKNIGNPYQMEYNKNHRLLSSI